MASKSVANKARVVWTRRRRLREGAGPPEAMVETAGWTRGCRRHVVAPVLPEEVVVWEILVRLPAKALLRCRAVCRSWHRLTSDPGFLAAHHRRQPALPLIKFSRMRDGLVVRRFRPFEEDDATLHACDLRRRAPRAERRPVVCLNPYGDRYTFHASCDGLLLLSSYDFYICNPATRECASLPGMADSFGVAGMYLHRASGEYRVLHWMWKKKTGDAIARPSYYYYVLAVGSSEASRPVVSSSGMEAAVLAAGMEDDQTRYRPPAPVMLHGCLHWDPGSWRWGDRVVVFDTVQETFRSISSPAPPAAACLLEMDGTLGMSSCDASDGTVRIWLLEDYGSEAWSLRFRIQLPTVENTVLDAQVTSLNGETLVCYSDGVFASSSALFRCDNKGGGLLKEFRWRTLEPSITGHWFKESLVRHAFFQTQDCSQAFTKVFDPK